MRQSFSRLGQWVLIPQMKLYLKLHNSCQEQGSLKTLLHGTIGGKSYSFGHFDREQTTRKNSTNPFFEGLMKIQNFSYKKHNPAKNYAHFNELLTKYFVLKSDLKPVFSTANVFLI
jgi:hypothetical protein